MTFEDINEIFLKNILVLGNFWNLNESTSRIWGTIILNDDGVSQKDILDKTGFSLSLISPALKELERINLIEKVYSKGKQKLYVASKSLAESVVALLLKLKNTQLQKLEEKLNDSLTKNQDEKEILSQIKRIKKEYEKLNSLISLVVDSEKIE
jgi:DNA-binding transcriptional regulator GbsR (MarR family)